jgi:PAS domain S-box-containing protein
MDETPNSGAAPAFDPRDLIPTPIFLCTIEGRIAWVNAAAEQLLGRSASELAGESFATIFPAEDGLRRARAIVRHHLSGETDFESEAPLATRHEAAHWVGLHVRKITTSNGRQAYVCSAHDLDASHRELESLRRKTKELEARTVQATAASQLKSEVLGTLSSELRAPMNGVISMSRLLMESALDRDQQMFAEVIHDSGRMLLELVDDVLDFSRIEAGQLKI